MIFREGGLEKEFMRVFVIGVLMLASLAQAQEKLIVKQNAIYTICSFDTVDYFTNLSPEGTFVWEMPFSSKIQSVEEGEDHLLILSKSRDGSAYFLSCIEKETGKSVWEKGIFAPRQTQILNDDSSIDAPE